MHDLADVLMRLVLEEHMDMLTGHLPGTEVDLVFDGDLPQHIPLLIFCCYGRGMAISRSVFRFRALSFY